MWKIGMARSQANPSLATAGWYEVPPMYQSRISKRYSKMRARKRGYPTLNYWDKKAGWIVASLIKRAPNPTNLAKGSLLWFVVLAINLVEDTDHVLRGFTAQQEKYVFVPTHPALFFLRAYISGVTKLHSLFLHTPESKCHQRVSRDLIGRSGP